MNNHFQNDLGGIGLLPVVSGVAPETRVSRGLALVRADQEQRISSDEIRRDAGFDGRDARATNLKTRPSNSTTARKSNIAND
jgi:hypothetical protein